VSSSATALAEAASLLGDLVRPDVPLGPRTTYRVGGPAALFAELRNEGDLAKVVEAVQRTDVAVLVVGKGSNLLVTDAGFDGLAISLGEGFVTIGDPQELDPVGDAAGDGAGGHVEVTGSVAVRAGGAAALPMVARRTVHRGLTGFEWAVGVPGSIGGAVRMNAGGHGSEMAEVLHRARLVNLRTGAERVVGPSELALGYRTSNVDADEVVAWAELTLQSGDRPAGEKLLTEIVSWRRANQPGGQNCGSVFSNPPGDAAGRLIDAAGCKGLRIGTAEVSTKHANFFQADPQGSADDVYALMREVQGRVAAMSGTVLHPETRLIGFPPLPGPSQVPDG
jgi:UDP-N-acetylmuramate dehydrogenase